MIICKYTTHKYGNNLKQIYIILIQVMKTDNSIPDTQLQAIKCLISKETNPKNQTESAKLFPDSKLLQQAMQTVADDFKQQVGRNMTYSEMRERMG